MLQRFVWQLCHRNMKQLPLLILLSVLLFGSCKKATTSCSSIAVKKAIVENDIELMRSEINKLCAGISIVRTSSDPHGLSNSLTELVRQLNNSCNIQAVSLCYFCIDTLPEQSEIKVSTGGVSRILDISYTNDKKLVFVNMHN